MQSTSVPRKHKRLRKVTPDTPSPSHPSRPFASGSVEEETQSKQFSLLGTLQPYLHLPRERWPDCLTADDRDELITERKRLKKLEKEAVKKREQEQQKTSEAVLAAYHAERNTESRGWNSQRVKVTFQLVANDRVAVHTIPATHSVMSGFFRSIEGARYESLDTLPSTGSTDSEEEEEEEEEKVASNVSVESQPVRSDCRVWTFPLTMYSPCLARLHGMRSDKLDVYIYPVDVTLLSAGGETCHPNHGSVVAPLEISKRIPACLWQNLYEFQREGVKFCIEKQGRALLGDEMGLGKSLQAITVAAYYAQSWPLLVICPSSLRLTWKNELLRWLGVSALQCNAKPTVGIQSELAGDDDIAIQNNDNDQDDEVQRPRKRRTTKRILDSDDEDDKNNNNDEDVRMNQLTRLPSMSTVDMSTSAKSHSSSFRELLPSEIQVLMDGKQLLMGSSSEKPRVVVCSYELVHKYRPALLEQRFRTVICDESHFLRNAESQRTQAVLPLLAPAHAEHVLLLSGTPATSRPCQLYSQLHALRPELFPSQHTFGSRYGHASMNRGKIEYSGGKNLHELHMILKRDLMIRRTKAEVLTQLRPKIRKLIYTSLSDPSLQYIKSNTEQDSDVSVSVADRWQATGIAKVPFICSYIDHLLDATMCTDKFLLFAHHRSVLQSLKAHLCKRGVDFMYLDGSTPAKERQEAVDRFQTDTSCRVALLSITAGGTGLTLSAASTVLFAELVWDPAVLCQAEDRVHRIGQAAICTCHYILAENSIDDHMWPILQSKLELTGRAIDGKDGQLQISSTVRT